MVRNFESINFWLYCCSTDNQSVDRVCRIGQIKDVIVYRLMTCETIEEKRSTKSRLKYLFSAGLLFCGGINYIPPYARMFGSHHHMAEWYSIHLIWWLSLVMWHLFRSLTLVKSLLSHWDFFFVLMSSLYCCLLWVVTLENTTFEKL